MQKSLWQCFLGGLFAIAFVMAMLGLVFGWGNSVALTTMATITAGALILVALLPQLSEVSFGPKGVAAKMSQLENEVEKTKGQVKDQEAKVQEHAKQLAKQQDLINDMVKFSMSDSIFRHLCGIGILKSYIYHDGDSDRREMYFLRDNGLIRPKTDQFLDFNQSRNNMNLVDIAEPTPAGWDSIRLRKDHISPELLKDRGNIKIDPSTL